MSDLIDRQAAIDALAEHEKSRGHNYTLFVDIVSECAEIIRNLPPAQPEIIRCRDCKHFAGEGMYCACNIIVHSDRFYCYYAERKED